jgi:hypothetical protein
MLSRFNDLEKLDAILKITLSSGVLFMNERGTNGTNGRITQVTQGPLQPLFFLYNMRTSAVFTTDGVTYGVCLCFTNIGSKQAVILNLCRLEMVFA